MKNTPIISQFGDHGILIQFQGEIAVKTNQNLRQFTRHLLLKFSPQISSYTTAYNESVIYLYPEISITSVLQNIEKEASIFKAKKSISTKNRIIKIPVCYESSFGLDIEQLAKEKNMDVSKIIELHTAPTYPVYFIGFAPGFPYLGEMNKKLAHPRKSKPRTKVNAGSVGIAGEQTGIYPNDSPGGWNIIGRSPLLFFDLNKESPALLQAGDAIQFMSIDKNEFKKIQKEIKSGTYTLQKTTFND